MSDRGAVLDMAAIRLAAEGVPVAAIARALLKKEREVDLILRDAQRQGLIRKIPKQDWPDGSRLDSRTPAIPPIPMADILDLAVRLQAFHGFSGGESRFLAAVIEMEIALDPVLIDVVDSGSASFSIIKVYAHRVRKRARNLFGVDLITIWGIGYRLSPEDREAVRLAVYPVKEASRAA